MRRGLFAQDLLKLLYLSSHSPLCPCRGREDLECEMAQINLAFNWREMCLQVKLYPSGHCEVERVVYTVLRGLEIGLLRHDPQRRLLIGQCVALSWTKHIFLFSTELEGFFLNVTVIRLTFFWQDGPKGFLGRFKSCQGFMRKFKRKYIWLHHSCFPNCLFLFSLNPSLSPSRSK